MAYQLLIAAKQSGQIYDVTNTTVQIDLRTERKTAPGKLTFQWIKTGNDVSFFEGDVVRLQVDGKTEFYGYVFTKDKNRWNEFTVTCYDRLRYLKANGSYAFYGRTAAEIIQEIGADLQLSFGELADTGYQIPSLIKSNQSCMNIIQEAIDLTLLNTGRVFCLYDNGDGLSLKASDEWISDVMIGTGSYLTDYHYKTDIDEGTYNYIKVTRPNEQTGMTEAVVAQDSANISKWGMLQQYIQVNGDYNTAQLTDMAKQTLMNVNRRKRTLSVSCLGVPGLRAGQMIRMNVPMLGDINLDQYVLLETVTHHYQEGVHTMDFETLEI